MPDEALAGTLYFYLISSSYLRYAMRLPRTLGDRKLGEFVNNRFSQIGEGDWVENYINIKYTHCINAMSRAAQNASRRELVPARYLSGSGTIMTCDQS